MALTISVITPSYNQGEFIERTLQSVLNQSIKPLEYFVFDGGSTDNTVDILKIYENQLSWTSEPDAGQAAAVNKGFKIAQGDIIGWLNSDDIYYPNAFQHVIDFFSKNPDINVLYGNANHIDKSNQIIEAYPTEPWNYDRLKSVCFLSQPAVFFRREIIEQYGVLDEKLHYCMDYEYWLRLGMKGASFAHIPFILAGSRFYMETKTMGQRVPVHAEINAMQRRVLGYTADSWLTNYAHVLVESHGFSREREKPFLLAIIFVSIYASLRWNRKISKALLKTIKIWFNRYCNPSLSK